MKELNIRNKRARFEFHLDEVFEAGIVLTGTEIKRFAWPLMAKAFMKVI